MQNILSFDVEDWYQGFIYRGIPGWEKFGSREMKNVEIILELLNQFNTYATFFILGNFAEKNPEVVKLIDKAGHEIASHGYSHIPVTKQTRKSFKEDLTMSKNILENIIGKGIIGHRAASFSINKSTLWALDIILETGFLYDSSIFPTSFHPYGNNIFNNYPNRINLESGDSILEFPAQVLSIGRIKLPVLGGFYFRAFPFFISDFCIKQSVKRNKPAMVYLHPYDIDEDVPRLRTNFSFRIIRYYKLSKGKEYLNRLLRMYQFTSIKNLIDKVRV